MLFIDNNLKAGKVIILFELICLLLCLITFSWFIRDQLPQQLISFFALVLIAWIISNHHQLVKDIGHQIKTHLFSKRMTVFNLIGLQLGTLIAVYFRFSSGMSILPQSFHWFLITGIAIAITEEALFRGVVQSMTERIIYYAAPLVAALFHSMYKTVIFIPLDQPNPNLISLFMGSLVAFTGLGYLKQVSKSIVPAVLAHVVFDVLVYAESVHAPWWVW